MSVTGIVHTKNEERDIARALRSLRPLCDQLLVADMGSTDRTKEIAEEFGARVLSVPDFGYVEPAWALALAHVDTEWAMRIDADEIVPPELAHRLETVVRNDEADVVEIGRRNFMFGRPLKGTGWAPASDRHFFLFKPGMLESIPPSESSIHRVMRPLDGARVTHLPLRDDLAVWHFNYIDWDHFVVKMNRYTTIEAMERADENPIRLKTLLRQSFDQLAWRGIRRKAWRDGYRGAGLVWMMVTYRVLVYLKSRQLADVGDASSIRETYDAVAAEALAA